MAPQNNDLLLGLSRLKACLIELSWRGIPAEKAIVTSANPSVLLNQEPSSLLSEDLTPTEQDGFLFIPLFDCRVCWRK